MEVVTRKNLPIPIYKFHPLRSKKLQGCPFLSREELVWDMMFPGSQFDGTQIPNMNKY